MMKLVEVKNVTWEANNKKGSLFFQACVNREAVYENQVYHYGLVVFFKPENESVKYVCSYIVDNDEERGFRLGTTTTMRDIGYILDVQNTRLMMMKMLGFTSNVPDENGWCEERILKTVFTIECEPSGERKLIEEQIADPRRKRCGFRRAMSMAFRECLNLVEGSIIPCDFPTEELDIITLDYLR